MPAHPKDRQVRTRRILAQGTVIVRQRDGSRPSHDEFVNLSVGGAFIKTMFPEEIGTVLDLELVLFYRKLRIAAEVCWTRGYEKEPDEPCGMAIKFLDVTSGQKKLLYRHIGELAKDGGRLLVGKPPRGRPEGDGTETPKPKRRSIWSFLTRK